MALSTSSFAYLALIVGCLRNVGGLPRSKREADIKDWFKGLLLQDQFWLLPLVTVAQLSGSHVFCWLPLFLEALHICSWIATDSIATNRNEDGNN